MCICMSMCICSPVYIDVCSHLLVTAFTKLVPRGTMMWHDKFRVSRDPHLATDMCFLYVRMIHIHIPCIYI